MVDLGGTDVLPAGLALGDHPAAETADPERQVLVVVVDDHDRADEAEQGAGRVLETLDQPALGSLAAILEVEGELVQRLRGGRLVARFGDCRLPGRPLVGRLGVRVGLGCAGLFRPLGIARHGGLVEPDVLRLRLGEGLQDVGRVVDLDELGSRVDDLGLGDPVAARLVVDAAPAAERPVRRDGQVLGIVVDQDQPAELADPALMATHEPIQLLARARQEVGALDLGVTGHVGQEGVASTFHVRPPTGGP